MLSAETSMTVGRVEYAPGYAGGYVHTTEAGDVQPFQQVGIVQPHPSGDNTFTRDSKAWNAWHRPPLTAANDNHRHELPKVVALTGRAGSGKSTLADYLIERHGYVRVKFAGPLKAMMRAIGLSDAHIEGELKELPCPLLQGKTPRYAMQTIGTEWGRDIIGPEFWTGLWADVANDVLDNGGRVVCDDCRFDNEADTVRRFGGVVIELQGRGGIGGGHASEGGIDADMVLHNVGSVADMYARADEVLFGGRW